MRISVLSGKGGTGKTFVSVDLAAAAQRAVYCDCDVEEPNGDLFFRSQIIGEQPVAVPVPKVNDELCIGCKRCVEFCRFNALAYVADQLLVFAEMCHSCGGCLLVCPEDALAEEERVIGSLKWGVSEDVRTYSGRLNPGEESGVPIIAQLLSDSEHIGDLTVIDCPPGSSCAVMESIKDADYCVLVAEPTAFGLHNLVLVHQLVKLMHKPHGVVLNKFMGDHDPTVEYCRAQHIPILMQIPFDFQLGQLLANGELAVRVSRHYAQLFQDLLVTITEEAKSSATAPHS